MIAIGPTNEPVLGDLKATNKPSNEARLKFLGLRDNQPILPFQTGEKTTCPLPILLISCFRIWRHLTKSGAKTRISWGGLPNAVARRSCGRFCGQFQHRHHGAQWDGRAEGFMRMLSAHENCRLRLMSGSFKFILNSDVQRLICAVYCIGICPLQLF